MALRFVFLTQQQRLNCVDVIITIQYASASAAARTPVDCSELHRQPVDAVLRSTFVQKLCYKLPSVVTFRFIQIFDQNFVFFTKQQSWAHLLHTASKFALFSVSRLKDDKKAQLTLTNPRDAEACKNCSNSTCFVSFHRIPFRQISNYRCMASRDRLKA